MFGKRSSHILLMVLLWGSSFVGQPFARENASFNPLSAISNPQSSGVSFIARRDYDIVGQPGSVTQGDFNGDELPDLAVLGSEVSILLGNSDGTFRLAHSFGVGRYPVAVTTGDFNGDKLLDLAVAIGGMAYLPGTVSILLGNGDGTFQSARDVAVGNGPTSSIIVGDFNGDEIPDLATTNAYDESSNNVSILLGNGDGTFESARNVAVGINPRSIAIGDFNGDKVQDLAVANWGTTYDPGTTVSILLGNGDGTFRPAPNVAVGGFPVSVAVGDFNGDEVQDLVVGSDYLPNISILLGNGDGTFRSDQSFSIPIFPVSVAVGDFNGDKIQDLAVANPSLDNVVILIGNGDGTFELARTLGVGRYPSAIVVGDFNGDKIPDLATTNRYSNNVSILLGNEEGTFRSPHDFVIERDPSSITVGDFNGDKIPDLALSRVSNPQGPVYAVSVLLGNKDGTFGPPQDLLVGRFHAVITVGDFDGDEIQDLAVVNSGSDMVSILIGNGDGTFGSPQNFTIGRGLLAVAIGDFNGDKVQDLAVTHSIGLNPGSVSILLGKGDGTFALVQTLSVGRNPGSIAVGDFNGDEIPDLVVDNIGHPRAPDSTVAILLGNGDGTFGPARNFPAGGYSVVVGDFDGDKIPDLALARSVSVSILFGNGDGTFGPVQSIAVGGSFRSLLIGDFNGDAMQDLALANAGLNAVSILLGNGDGTFRAAQNFGVGRYPNSIAVGDFNADNRPDLAVANWGSNNVTILINDTPTQHTSSMSQPEKTP